MKKLIFGSMILLIIIAASGCQKCQKCQLIQNTTNVGTQVVSEYGEACNEKDRQEQKANCEDDAKMYNANFPTTNSYCKCEITNQ